MLLRRVDFTKEHNKTQWEVDSPGAVLLQFQGISGIVEWSLSALESKPIPLQLVNRRAARGHLKSKDHE